MNLGEWKKSPDSNFQKNGCGGLFLQCLHRNKDNYHEMILIMLPAQSIINYVYRINYVYTLLHTHISHDGRNFINQS